MAEEIWDLLTLGSPPDWIDGQYVTVSLTIPPNTAPTAASGAVTIDEDTTYAFSVSDFNFMDADGDELRSVEITTLETSGDLKLDSADVMLSQEITRADIDAGKLTFTPAENANGPIYDSFWFKVSDGIDESSVHSVMSIVVTAVNDAPTAADNTVTTAEDTAYAFTVADFRFSDVDGDTLASVTITSLETDGDLELDGTDVEVDDEITKANIDDGKLTFTPDSGESGDDYATFDFTVNDGETDSVSAYTMTIDVGADANTAPTAEFSVVFDGRGHDVRVLGIGLQLHGRRR